MINKKTMLFDDFDDEVLNLLKDFRSCARWDKKKQRLHQTLISLLESKNYIFFTSGHHRYFVSTVGSSYLYDVPLYKRGHLRKFRGKRVRIICTNSGKHSSRGYRVGIVDDSPQDKIIRKLKYNYSFPDYVHGHSIIHKSTRFMILESNRSIAILSDVEFKGYINSSGWDSFLVDGKRGRAIAVLKRNTDGTVEGKVLGWSTSDSYPSLREAINTLKDKVWF